MKLAAEPMRRRAKGAKVTEREAVLDVAEALGFRRVLAAVPREGEPALTPPERAKYTRALRSIYVTSNQRDPKTRQTLPTALTFARALFRAGAPARTWKPLIVSVYLAIRARAAHDADRIAALVLMLAHLDRAPLLKDEDVEGRATIRALTERLRDLARSSRGGARSRISAIEKK